MKLKKLTNSPRISIIIPFTLVITASLIFSKSFFNNKEIQTLSQNCFNSGGNPTVELGTLNLDYSFECIK